MGRKRRVIEHKGAKYVLFSGSLTDPSGRTFFSITMRSAPNITISTRPYDARLIGAGWDTFEECLSVFIFEKTWQKLEEAKKHAYEQNKKLKGKNQSYSTTFCGLDFQIKGHGAEGVAFILESPDFTIRIRHASEAWNLSIKYHSCALWQYTLHGARQRLFDALRKEMNPRPQMDKMGNDIGWQRVSRCDYAFDFHSPQFTQEMGYSLMDQLICHSSCKVQLDFKAPEYFENKEDKETHGYMIGTSARVQTLTIGNKATLEIQIYDKTTEITEASGKTWMYKVWAQSGFEADANTKDVWRLEVRMGRDWLRDHEINTLEDLEKNLELLLSEALKTRRLADPPGRDTNKRRWPVHPLWGQAIELAGNCPEMLPIGKQVEQSGEMLKDRIKRDIKARVRSLNAALVGDYDNLFSEDFLKEILEEIQKDSDHEDKMLMYAEKHKYINCPR